MLWLFVAFVVLPVVEIWLITQVADPIGWPLTILLVIGVSVAGAWLVRREGIGVIQRVRRSLGSGQLPTTDLADGAMIFFASALMLTPGFLTDGIGLALLIPPIRAILRPPLITFFRRRLNLKVAGIGGMGVGQVPFGAGFGGRPKGRTGVVDVDGRPTDEEPSGRPDEPGEHPELD